MLKNCATAGGKLEETRKDEEEISGYDYEFYPQLDVKYSCPICLLALKQPVQTLCGHRFCYHCIITCIRKRPRCPVDQEALDETQIFQDRSTEREVLDLRVRCPHKSCHVISELRYMQTHEEECEHRAVICSLGCGRALAKRDVDEHEREECDHRRLSCPNCGQDYLFKNQKVHVTEECEQANKMARCPHCSREMKRYKVRGHVDGDCSRAPIRCVFHKVGCLQEHSRMDICRHMEESTQVHLQYLLSHVTRIEGENSKLKEELQVMRSRVEDLHTSDDVDDDDVAKEKTDLKNPQKTDLKSPKKTGSSRLFVSDSAPETLFGSSSFGTSDQGSNEMMSLRVPGPPGRRRSLSPCRTSEYETRTEFENKFVKIEHVVRELLVKTEFQSSRVKHLSAELVRAQSEQLLRNCNGVFYWKIDGFERRRKEAVRGDVPVLNSRGFYTSPFGYRLSVRANLNGVDDVADDVAGSHMSLFIHMMRGDNDDMLTWPFAGSISMTLVNQRQHALGMASSGSGGKLDISETIEVGRRRNLEAFKRCSASSGVDRNDKGYGFVHFCPIRSVETDGFVLNDSLLIKIHVISSP